MKIAIFASAFHPSLGGVEELSRQLAHAHVEAGHEVIVITERWPRNLVPYEKIEDITVFRFPMRVPAGSLKARLTYAATHRIIRARVAYVVHKFRADVIHVQCVSSATHYAMYVKSALSLPLLVTLQGELTMDAAGVFLRPGFARTMMREALRAADFVTACSKHTLAEAESFAGFSLAEKSEVVYNGIRIKDFDAAQLYAHGRRYILAMGRHVRQKGFDVLLRAFATASDIGYDLVLAGDGPETESLKALCTELGLGARARFVGRANRSTVEKLFKGCAFFVLPSRHEPFGIVNLEAMVAGKAVIASRVGGVAEIVEDGVTGLLVPPEDGEALTAAILRLVNDPETSRRLGSAGQERARQFDWAVIARRYRALYCLANERLGKDCEERTWDCAETKSSK